MAAVWPKRTQRMCVAILSHQFLFMGLGMAEDCGGGWWSTGGADMKLMGWGIGN